MRIRILWLKRMLRIPMASAKIMDTMDETVFICPIMPRSTPNVADMSSRKRAVRIPRVLAEKFEIIKEGRNSLLSEAFLST